jgi:serine/threonine protein kinase
MGLVFKAFDADLQRVVALKVLAPELCGNATARKRFVREGRAAAAVLHENVIAIHGVEESGGVPFLVMQYVDGRSLQERLDAEGPLPVADIVRIGIQTAAGLAAAHGQGLIHRDIKPTNILLENGVERVKLTDFGLARAVDDVGTTQHGTIVGTPLYMAPEQARGDAVDARADLFSLGCVLYTMCTGESPFQAGTTLEVLRRVNEDVPRSIRVQNGDIPEWLESVILRLLAKRPDERFASAAEVVGLLTQQPAHGHQPNKSVPLPWRPCCS